jgi:hypothetical protein
VLAVAALVLSSCGDGSPDDPDSPRGLVEQIKVGLVEADGAAVRALVDDRSSAVSTELLTDEVLAEGVFAGKDVMVEKTSSDIYTVRYDLLVDGDGNRPWLDLEVKASDDSIVGMALPTIELSGSGVSAVTVNGVEVAVEQLTSEPRSFYLPPGELEIGAVGPKDLVAHEPPQPVDTREYGDRALELAGTVTEAGLDRIQEAVDAYVADCTKARDASPPTGCPVHLAWVGGLASSRMTLDDEPKWSLQPSSDGWTILTEDPPKARLTGTTREGGPAEDVVDFAVTGTVRVVGGELLVEVPEQF